MSVLKVPVLAISFFNVATSLLLNIESDPIRACHLAASPATIPVDTPFTAVSPSIFGRSPDINI